VTLLAATAGDLIVAAGAGFLGVVVVSGGLALLSARQRLRVESLATASFTFEVMERAAQRAERENSELVHDVLQSAVADVAADQDLSDGVVAAAVFVAGRSGSLEPLEGPAFNLDRASVLLRMSSDETGVDQAIQGGHPVVTVFPSADEDATASETERRDWADSPLRWIISVPILAEDGRPVWVLSVAGLVEDRSPEDLQSSVGHLLYYGTFLELLLKRIAGKKDDRQADNHQ
jgi:hypothetical protein